MVLHFLVSKVCPFNYFISKKYYTPHKSVAILDTIMRLYPNEF